MTTLLGVYFVSLGLLGVILDALEKAERATRRKRARNPIASGANERGTK